MYIAEIVFVDIAKNPDIREVGDGEGIRRGQSRNSASIRHLLIRDHSGCRRANIYDCRGMLEITAKDAEPLGRILNINLGLLRGVLRDLQAVQANRASIVKQLRSF